MINYKTEYYETIKPNYKAYDEALPEYWHMKYRDQFKECLALFNEPNPRPKLLDIGCGRGRAMQYFKGLGAEVIGVEPSDYAAAEAKKAGLEVINEYFENIKLDGMFDIIHIEQVLSHAPRYKDILLKASKLLSSDGVLIIEEPNDYNALQLKLEPTHGQYWVTEDHCNYFNYDKMWKAICETKLEQVHSSCTYPMEFFVFQGLDYINEPERGREAHYKRFQLLSKVGYQTRRKLLAGYADIGLGRDLVVYARHPHWEC